MSVFTPLLAHRTMLAPMEGVGHPTFRQLMADRGGIGMVCTEFVRVSRAPLSIAALRREVVKARGVPLSVQVMGNEADKMADAAAVVCEAGADVVDVNLGCPMPRVVRKGVGAAMLKDPELLLRVLSAMRRSTPRLLSAKIRAGFETADDAITIARVVEAAGCDFLVVHPRRRCDFYEGTADWRIIRVLKEALEIPVVGNGDVWYAADALRMERETGCDAVMIGRPSLRNPWIFQQVADLRAGRAPHRPCGAELVAHLRTVARRYEAVFRQTVGKLKELLRFVARAVEDRSFLREVLRQENAATILELCDARLSDLGPEELDLDAHGSLSLERSGSASGTPAPRAPSVTLRA